MKADCVFPQQRLSPSDTFTVADFLLHRLCELGVRHIFGVAGEDTRPFIERLARHPRIVWVGDASAVGAEYSARGYALARGIAALLTTKAVAELEPGVDMARSDALWPPIIHIVAAPPSSATLHNAAVEIDRAIAATLSEARPSFLLVPVDVATQPVAPPREQLAFGTLQVPPHRTLRVLK